MLCYVMLCYVGSIFSFIKAEMKVNKTVIAASTIIFYVNYFKIVEHLIHQKEKCALHHFIIMDIYISQKG